MKKSDIAVEYFLSGYNCSQAVVAAFCEDFGMSVEDGVRVSEGFGGGMGRMRSVCGAVTGMFMLAGLKHSNSQPKDLETRKLIYSLVQEMSAEFEQEMGSIICAELLGENAPADKGAAPAPRNGEFFKKRPCTESVRIAAEIAEKYLCNQ